MTWKRHTEEQMIAGLQDAQAGIGVPELCRKHRISNATFYKWRTKYTGLVVSDVKKLRQLEDENQRLRQMAQSRTGLRHRLSHREAQCPVTIAGQASLTVCD